MNPFDPVPHLQGLCRSHQVPGAEYVLVGIPLLENNTIGYTTQFTEYFPTGTGVQWTFNGQRQTSNSPLNIVDPQIQLFWQAVVTQPLLAGFGFGTNERWIRIAKRNLQITDYAFKAQVIATVTRSAEYLLGPRERLRGRTD